MFNFIIKMFLSLIFTVVISTCIAADVTVTPPFICGEIPTTIYSCLGNPRFIKPDVSVNCDKDISECDRMTCIFTKAGWLKDGKVEKQKVMAHYDQFAKDYPEWSTAVQHAKAACLAFDLPAQGASLNCPAYDIMLCSLSSFIKNAQPSQWSTAAQCQHPKQYAALCPVCPSGCFAQFVPYGSCNACLALPRSP